MTQPDLFDALDKNRAFGGETYEPERDFDRLSRQLRLVKEFMSDGKWHILAEISKATGGTEASVSARLRDLRKDKYGGHMVLREYVSKGLFRYRVLPRLMPTEESDA